MNKHDKTLDRLKKTKIQIFFQGDCWTNVDMTYFFRRLSLAAALQRNSNRLKKSTF